MCSRSISIRFTSSVVHFRPKHLNIIPCSLQSAIQQMLESSQTRYQWLRCACQVIRTYFSLSQILSSLCFCINFIHCAKTAVVYSRRPPGVLIFVSTLRLFNSISNHSFMANLCLKALLDGCLPRPCC